MEKKFVFQIEKFYNMKNIGTTKKHDQRRKPEKNKVQKEAPRNIQFKKNEIYSLKDIGSCVSSLTINNCPIFSLKGLNNFESVKTFSVKNGLIFSFKDAGIIKKIENISFEGCPIARYPYYRLMVLLLFATNDIKIKTIDSDPVTEEEKTIVKNCLNAFSSLDSSESSLVQLYLKNGGIIRTIEDLSPDVIRRRVAPNIAPPASIKSSVLPSLSFSPFLTPNAIQENVITKANQLANISIEKKICDYQNNLRSYQLEFDDIFTKYDLLNPNTPILPLYQHIQNIYGKVDKCIQEIANVELPKEISQDVISGHDFQEAIKSIIQVYQDAEGNLKSYLINTVKSCQDNLSVLSNSKISAFCQDYVNILKQVINVIENILNSQSFSIDFAISNVSKISEINTSFVSPYYKVFDAILGLTKKLLNIINDHSIQKHIVSLYQKVSFYRKRPLFSRFDQILEQVAMIQSCLGGAENDEKANTLIEISTLCQNSMEDKIFNIYTNHISTDEIIRNIEESRKSFALFVISFRKNTNYAFSFPKTQKLSEDSYVRSKSLEQYIKSFENHINENHVITTYIKDRIFDCSNDKVHNVYISSMLKMKKEEVDQKNKLIEKLKELIAAKKSG